MSSSSNDGEASNTVSPSVDQSGPLSTTASDDTASHSKKRPAPDAVDGARRRAAMACQNCRARKSRCDGVKPRCGLCLHQDLTCEYRSPTVKHDNKEIIKHLEEIKELLQSSKQASLAGSASAVLSPVIPSSSSGDKQSPEFIRPEAKNRRASSASYIDMIPVSGAWPKESANISTMPRTHTTPAFHLLQWPKIRDLIGTLYDPQDLLDAEMARESLDFSQKHPIDLKLSSLYTQTYFEHVNRWYACVNPYDWSDHYNSAAFNNFQKGPQSCIVLLVFALGEAGSNQSIYTYPRNSMPPGWAFFTNAWSLLPSLLAENTMISAQCYILAAAYLFYIVRPLEAWSLINNVSSKLQLLRSTLGKAPSNSQKLFERLYWNALLFESDLLAELHLPHSGIVQFHDAVDLPTEFAKEGNKQAGEDDLWYFLSKIQLRRELNKVSSTLYTDSTSGPSVIAKLDRNCKDLDTGLGVWHDKLPRHIQFPLSLATAATPVQTVLRLRFFACQTIIYRPYILQVLKDESIASYQNVKENCSKCLYACKHQLEHIQAHRAGHLPYLWQGALSMVSQTLLIMGASMSPALMTLLPEPHKLDAMIQNVINEIELYAHLSPGISLSATILRQAENERRRRNAEQRIVSRPSAPQLPAPWSVPDGPPRNSTPT